MPAHQPSVLIVYVHEMRPDCMGTTGNPDIKTPNLDRRAS